MTTVDDLLGGVREMADSAVGKPADMDPAVHALMLAELGQAVLNAAASTFILGHTRLAYSVDYGSIQTPVAKVAVAIVKGDANEVRRALNEWWPTAAEKS